MALVTCKECGAGLSSAATACPHCGRPRPKRTSVGTWLIGGFFSLIVVSCVMARADRNSDSPVAAPPTPEGKSEQTAIEAQRSRELQRVSLGAYSLRGVAKVPSSFKLSSAEYHRDGSVCYEYESSNSFNALLRGRAVVEAGVDGLLAQEQHGQRFINAWNKHCTKDVGTDYARDVTQILKMTK